LSRFFVRQKAGASPDQPSVYARLVAIIVAGKAEQDPSVPDGQIAKPGHLGGIGRWRGGDDQKGPDMATGQAADSRRPSSVSARRQERFGEDGLRRDSRRLQEKAGTPAYAVAIAAITFAVRLRAPPEKWRKALMIIAKMLIENGSGIIRDSDRVRQLADILVQKRGVIWTIGKFDGKAMPDLGSLDKRVVEPGHLIAVQPEEWPVRRYLLDRLLDCLLRGGLGANCFQLFALKPLAFGDGVACAANGGVWVSFDVSSAHPNLRQAMLAAVAGMDGILEPERCHPDGISGFDGIRSEYFEAPGAAMRQGGSKWMLKCRRGPKAADQRIARPQEIPRQGLTRPLPDQIFGEGGDDSGEARVRLFT
jgi:hypothetical protein